MRNRSLPFLLSFLFVVSIFLSLPEKGFSGFAQVPQCCQTTPDQCADLVEGGPACVAEDVVQGFCDEETGLCREVVVSTSPIPTLNDWGLISVVIVLGVVGALGILAYRRRRAST